MSRDASHTALLWIVAAAFFMQSLDTTIVNTALPSIAQGLHASPLAMQPVVVVYTLTMAMLTPASGWLADRFGTRRVFSLAILVFVLASIGCAASHTLGQLVAARALQGVGGSMLLPIGRLAVLRRVPGEQYVSALAFVSIAAQLGPIVGPTLGGWLTQAISWHWVFIVNVPVGAIGLVAVQRFLPHDQATQPPPFDFIGCALLSVAMVALSLAIDPPMATQRGAWATGLAVIGLASALAYLPHARRRAQPLFRLGLFREPNFGAGLLGNLLCRIGTSALPFMLPLLMQVQLGYTPLQSGMMMLPAAIAGVIAKRWIAPLVRRFGYAAFLVANTGIVGSAIAGFALVSARPAPALEIALLVVFGAANSMQFAAMNSVTLKGLSHADAASGNSLFTMMQMLAMGLGVSIGGGLINLFAARLGSTASGFMLAFVCMGAVTLLSSLVFRRIDTPAAPRPATSRPAA
ncbi:DHA2 family efflux MFS transporter permease subunit [Burkholderia multivorans]|uniref:DHA2 family efflux MFS transporter permease subunit n=1 Tax=Burkholderia multivorans TaxID=87883 RepID=UPI000317E9E3|nr:DHA2 family efflux MFS transporter permease subunit [Burkholderia multivorans]MBJ9655546.1 DHA2 family efflux MFS transporter permease subunit [Burkholderia multivorans]MBU9469710.1 DHA2 family efflux MFS transporter permease subunit [Burkholderia multivorans]MDR8872273.1 putative transport protein HsrA [Burkholderia multivorans]MDR8881284.1 putative transport protein HsrA [Burkholderia multivorans]MDR8884982.1 putative transport protein HsrA [Burkholderia multivorans]